MRPCKAFGRSISASLPNPQAPFPGERLCMLGWLCIVQSPCAYTPGIRAGAILLGLPPQTKQGCLQSAAQSHYARTHNDSHTKPLHDATAQMAVNAQMQRHKQLTLQRCKTNRASNTRHPIFNIYKRFFDSLKAKPLRRAAHFNFTLKLYINVRCPKRRRTFCIMNDEKGIVLNIM